MSRDSCLGSGGAGADGEPGTTTRCVFMTTGVLLALITRDGPESLLRSYTHIVIDEAHERDTDLHLVSHTSRAGRAFVPSINNSNVCHRRMAATTHRHARPRRPQRVLRVECACNCDAQVLVALRRLLRVRLPPSVAEHGDGAETPMHAEGYSGLRLIIMSATIDANRIAQFFCNPDTGEPAAILHVGKQPFEVQSFHSDALREALPADFPQWKEHAPSRSSQAARLDPAMYDAACYLIRALGDGTIEAALPGALSDAELEAQEASQHGGNANQSLGAVLIFVPGQAEIYELLHAISGGSAGVDPRWIQLVPLHSLLDDDAQRTAFAPAPAGMRKVRQTPDAGRQNTDSRSICRSCRPIA